jgi:hypothetical protein
MRHPNYKKFVNKHFVFFDLSYLPVGVSLLTVAVIRQHIWTAFSTAPLFLLVNFLMEPFSMFIGHAAHVFRGKKTKCKCRK